MTTNAVHIRPFLWVIVAAMVLTVLVLSGLLVGGRATSLQSQDTLLLLRQDGEWLVLYVAADTDLDGIELIVSRNNENFRHNPFDFFDVLQLNDGNIEGGSCLIIEQQGTEAVLPSECADDDRIFRAEVAQSDIFWYDLTRHQPRTINVLQNSITVATCNPESRCGINWNPLPPVVLTPITPNFILPGHDNTGEIEAYTIEQLLNQTGLNTWRAAGFNGSDIKIGVIDRHFGGIGGSGITVTLPPNATYGGENLNQGVAVLEIIHDIAPNAQLFACQYATFGQFHDCVDWLIENHVQIINHSANIPLSQSASQPNWAGEVTRARQENILWIDGAGNFQGGILRREFLDQIFPNGRHEFTTAGGINEVLGFSGIQNLAGTVMLTWSDFNSQPANTFDLDLIITDARTGIILAQSAHTQQGSLTDEAVEIVTFDMHDTFGVQIVNSTGKPVDGLEFTLYVEFGSLDNVSEGFTTPADSPDALTVGVARDNAVAPYSLRGDPHGIVKPNLLAPGDIRLRNDSLFIGTSASAPVVSGYAALVLDAYPSYSIEELRGFIVDQSTQDSPFSNTSNTNCGEGYLYVPAPPSQADTVLQIPTPTGETPATPTPALPPDVPVAIVTVREANLRAGPHVAHRRVGSAFEGDVLVVEGQADGWYRVQRPNEYSAWVAGSIVEISPEGAEIYTLPDSDIPALPSTPYPEVTATFPPLSPTVPGRDVPGGVLVTPTSPPRIGYTLTPVFTAPPNETATQGAAQTATQIFGGLTQTAILWTNTPLPTQQTQTAMAWTATPNITQLTQTATLWTPSATRTPTIGPSITISVAPLTLPRTPTNTFTPTTETPRVTITTGANLRSCPGTNYSRVGGASIDQQFPVSARYNGPQYTWYLVQHPTSGPVWVANNVATPNVPDSQIPVVGLPANCPATFTPTPPLCANPYCVVQVVENGVHCRVIESSTNTVVFTTSAQYSTPNDVKACYFSVPWTEFLAFYHYGQPPTAYTWVWVWSAQNGQSSYICAGHITHHSQCVAPSPTP